MLELFRAHPILQLDSAAGFLAGMLRISQTFKSVMRSSRPPAFRPKQGSKGQTRLGDMKDNFAIDCCFEKTALRDGDDMLVRNDHIQSVAGAAHLAQDPAHPTTLVNWNIKSKGQQIWQERWSARNQITTNKSEAKRS